jgi:hypothetical protein
MIKVHIKLGSAEIEIEGDAKGVHDILERHWEAHVEAMLSIGIVETGPEESHSVEPSQQQRPAGRKRKSSGGSKPTKSIDDKQLVESIANKIKGLSDFNALKAKFIVGKTPIVEKAKLVLNNHDEPLGSGTVLRVLERLGVKTSAPTVSRALSENESQFITTGNPKLYRMSGATQEEFYKSISADAN